MNASDNLKFRRVEEELGLEKQKNILDRLRTPF
jgi:hypothetical protein